MTLTAEITEEIVCTVYLPKRAGVSHIHVGEHMNLLAWPYRCEPTPMIYSVNNTFAARLGYAMGWGAS